MDWKPRIIGMAMRHSSTSTVRLMLAKPHRANRVRWKNASTVERRGIALSCCL